jgi:dihydroorotate dehydrogenase (NAD+) catalytic subunit
VFSLKNGHKLDFLCASGALAWYGEGWWWERPLRKLGLIRSDELTIISKTLTYLPLKGNLRMWCPWRCVRLIKGGAVNSVGLTNPGYEWWLRKCSPKIEKTGWKVIVSIMPQNASEAVKMISDLNPCPIVGIELNVSCPNIKREHQGNFFLDHVKEIVYEILATTKHPLIVKLGYTDPYLEVCKELDGKVDAFDLINTVPWNKVFPDSPSPLAKYDLVGGVSGTPIRGYAREALTNALRLNLKTPIISGGGIDCLSESYLRFVLGAKAVSLGTVFLRAPWKVNGIVRGTREMLKWNLTN